MKLWICTQKWHPDKQKGQDSATSRFQDINEAYQGMHAPLSLSLSLQLLLTPTYELSLVYVKIFYSANQ